MISAVPVWRFSTPWVIDTLSTDGREYDQTGRTRVEGGERDGETNGTKTAQYFGSAPVIA